MLCVVVSQLRSQREATATLCPPPSADTWLHADLGTPYERNQYKSLKGKTGLESLRWDKSSVFKLHAYEKEQFDDAFTISQVWFPPRAVFLLPEVARAALRSHRPGSKGSSHVHSAPGPYPAHVTA